MSILNRVTLKTLRKNPTRTAVTVIGVILSAAMICAVTTFAASFLGYMRDEAVYSSGDWHASDMGVLPGGDAESDRRVSAASVIQDVGYALLEGCKNEYKPYLFIGRVNDDFLENMPVHLTSGRLPTGENELLLPDHLAENGGLKYSLGDTLTLDVGVRLSEGSLLRQDAGYSPDIPEELADKRAMSFTVVGFYERPGFEYYSAPGYTALLYGESFSPDEPADIYYKLSDPSETYELIADYSLNGATNWEVLALSGVSRYGGYYTAVYGMAAVVIVLIIFGSVSLIYNAFAISVSQRTKQIGLLISVGATKGQIRRSVLFESLVISAVGIPLGILAGIGGIGVTLRLLRPKLILFFGSSLPMRLSVSLFSILSACVIALFTVLISAWIPTRRASKITAIDAIRQTNDINIQAKEVKTSRLTAKLFGFEGSLASKYFKRSRKSYRSTVLSLFMSVVLFISASSFCMYLTEFAEGPYGSEKYDIEASIFSAENEEQLEDIYSRLKSVPGVTDSAMQSFYSMEAELMKAECSEQYASAAFRDGSSPESTNRDMVQLVFLEDSRYRELLSGEKLDEDSFFDPASPLALLYDNCSFFDNTAGRYVNTPCLDKKTDRVNVVFDNPAYKDYFVCDIEYGENGIESYILEHCETGEHLDLKPSEFELLIPMAIGARLEEAPLGVTSRSFSLIYPLSLYESVMGKAPDYTNILFTADDPGSVYEAMENAVRTMNTPVTLYNYAETQESERSMITVIKVFSYGFIVLISLIAVANVFNTITTNVGLRRREFAVLKSVGMSGRGFNRMAAFECVLYGLRSLLFGLPVSVGTTYLVYKAADSGYMNTFHLPMSAVLIAILSVFATVCASMLYSMRSIKKDNPIEALKNENL